MIEILLLLAYLGLSLLVRPIQEAVTLSVVTCLCALGVLKATGSNSLRQAFGWFRQHPWHGALIVLLVIASTAAGLAFRRDDLRSIASTLLFSVAAFFWFWVFDSLGTRFSERRLRKAVDAELRRRGIPPD
ncbi:hypothetical protein [Aquabacterium sp.]|uniref:hypothetical protein n=1 Tax=Aquabacterium sp. TaxID=1872578 RepID=UPI003784985B